MSKKQKNGDKPAEPASTPNPPAAAPPPEVPPEPTKAAEVTASAVPNNPEQTKVPNMPTETNESNELAETNNETTAIAPVADEKKANQAVMFELAKQLPSRYKMDVMGLNRPTPTELMELIDKQAPDVQMALMTLAAKTNPKKQGMHSTRSGFSPIGIKMYHGTGNDPLRPAKMPKGEFYTEDSRMLGESFVGAVIAVNQGRTKWPSKDLGEDGKAPICSSPDRLVGSKYGDCNSCTYARGKYTEGGCGQDMTVYIVDKELTGVYSVQFSKTSASNGNALMKILEKSKNLWDRWFEFKIESREKKEDNYVWYATKAAPLTDPKNPNAATTDIKLHPVFDAFSRIIDADVYYPKLAAVYSMKKEAPPKLASDAPTINPDQIGGSISGDNGDFGGNGTPNV